MKKLFNSLRPLTKEKITACLFVIVIFGMLLGMVTNVRTVGGNFLTNYRQTVLPGTPVVERLKGAIKSVEFAVGEGCFRRQDYIEAYGIAMNALGKHSVTDVNYGAVYKTRDGQITFAVPQKWVDGAAYNTELLCSALRAEGTDFLYVQLPFKVAPTKYGGQEELPPYVHDYSNENADEFLRQISEAGVDTFDLREPFWKSGRSQKELFFDTDHHWTIDSAFMATDFLTDYMNDYYGLGIENIYKEENFEKTLYKNFFIGSMGRRVGRFYGGIDDFTLYTPKFDTSLTLHEISGDNDVVTEGSFKEAVLDWEYMEGDDPTNNRYAVYHGDFEELIFTNRLVTNGKKILIIKDSFGIPMYSFLSLGVTEVRAIDLRLFSRDVVEYAREYKPDIVILMYNADSFAEEQFNFHIGQ